MAQTSVINSIKNAYMEIYNLLAIMHERAEPELTRRITNLNTRVVSLIMFGVGVVLLQIVSNPSWSSDHTVLAPLIKDVGGLVAGSGLVAFIWEISLRRTFFNEVMEKIGVATDVNISGLSRITLDFYHDVNWRQLFKNVKNLDILFSYGGTWRHVNEVELGELAKQRSVSVRVILPDPRDKALIEQLGCRYGYTGDEMRNRVLEAERDFRGKFEGKPSRLAIYYIKKAPAFDVYRFDDVAIITMFKHRVDRVPVPTFQVKKGGTLYDFVDMELAAIFDEKGDIAVPVGDI